MIFKQQNVLLILTPSSLPTKMVVSKCAAWTKNKTFHTLVVELRVKVSTNSALDGPLFS